MFFQVSRRCTNGDTLSSVCKILLKILNIDYPRGWKSTGHTEFEHRKQDLKIYPGYLMRSQFLHKNRITFWLNYPTVLIVMSPHSSRQFDNHKKKHWITIIHIPAFRINGVTVYVACYQCLWWTRINSHLFRCMLKMSNYSSEISIIRPLTCGQFKWVSSHDSLFKSGPCKSYLFPPKCVILERIKYNFYHTRFPCYVIGVLGHTLLFC